jgi:F-type H+-transporting ATPase subunit a
MAILVAVAIALRLAIKRFEEVPRGVQNGVEAVIEMFDNFVKGAVDPRLMGLGNWFFAVFSFILLSNLSGLIPIPGLRPPTADWATTFAFAIATFILIQVFALKFRGRKYIKSFFEPVFVFFPLNLIGELARPISLSFRLYGNILAGVILMGLIYNMTPLLARFGIPVALHVYFDIFSGAIQTYIFCILSLSFISAAAVPNE